ncbi:hypothetical protein Kpol_1051p5 [Vanderwaltozyma polyspora DSM 70294]|uniref:Central kinetochore subunit MCM21 n=1 Tax=Vanderwaltozyma polyspora (strain ATCC 22028 / DSM 70294 / BCRC 21397 / CBS 2163 / NBRC 10782 / NRRL Y-8283 / UCD 57-17) TaxID=436907 RepID=A7TMW9_VANPO|nr:uncharacterized protein Kpol_1051p5 [Vanderwaltozyma polyspora DSM 70294]EDO16357.1 hypothetical protein Kpol_1051p5 [Vanderwaltozyma polyspora DSM 70294]
MSDLLELEQDVTALRREIESLTKRRDAVKDKLANNEIEEYTQKPISKDFEDLFQSHPQLYDLLSSDKDKNKSKKKPSSEERDEGKHMTSEISNKRVKPNEQDTDISEDEWILKSQPLVQHKMFNSGISDMINTDILTSPSKRKLKLGNIDDDSETSKGNKQKNLNKKIRIENLFRLFGITFFPLVDPTDLKMNKELKTMEIKREMLGIRLEIYNEHNSTFEKPHYILLKKKLKIDSWMIFKHTIPSYIDIESKWFGINNGMLNTYDEINVFAKEVYIELIHGNIREQKIQKLTELEYIRDCQTDVNSSRVILTLIDQYEIELFLKNETIVSCKIPTDRMEPMLKNKWQIILLGTIDELPNKLSQLNNMLN